MYVYYIFSINKMFNPIYQNKSHNIYMALNKIKKYDKKELLLAKKMYSRIIEPIERRKIDNYLLMNYMNNNNYTKINSNHELVNNNEFSRLLIYNTYIKIITSNNISSFLNDLYNINRDYFVIDFKNENYFFLQDLKTKLLV